MIFHEDSVMIQAAEAECARQTDQADQIDSTCRYQA